jgi:hypothetical protein
MIRTERQHQIDRAIVRTLLQCGDLLVLDAVIFDAARMGVAPPPTQAELDESMEWLDAQRRIFGLQTEIGPKHKLTEAGRAWAAENRIR